MVASCPLFASLYVDKGSRVGMLPSSRPWRRGALRRGDSAAPLFARPGNQSDAGVGQPVVMMSVIFAAALSSPALGSARPAAILVSSVLSASRCSLLVGVAGMAIR